MSTSESKFFNGSKWPWKLEQPTLEDYFVLRDADGRYVSDALIEGTAQQFLDIALALVSRRDMSHKRCAASLHPSGSYYEFCSPRNTLGGYARLELEFADELAQHIELTIADWREAEYWEEQGEDDEGLVIEKTSGTLEDESVEDQ